jgi:hypothetical protein
LREIDLQFLASENQGEMNARERQRRQLDTLAILSATMRLQNDFRLHLLDILEARECSIENIFSSSHNTEKQRRFLSRMECQTIDENLKLMIQ